MEPNEYARRVLEVYHTTPGTCGIVRRADHERGVPAEGVEDALIVAPRGGSCTEILGLPPV